MANWNLPTLTDLYTNILTYLKQRDDDNATMFRDGTATNIPTGAIKWNASASKFESWATITWETLDTEYDINVTKLGNVLAADYCKLAVNQTLTGNKTFNGYADFVGNVYLNGTLLTPTASTLNLLPSRDQDLPS